MKKIAIISQGRDGQTDSVIYSQLANFLQTYLRRYLKTVDVCVDVLQSTPARPEYSVVIFLSGDLLDIARTVQVSDPNMTVILFTTTLAQESRGVMMIQKGCQGSMPRLLEVVQNSLQKGTT